MKKFCIQHGVFYESKLFAVFHFSEKMESKENHHGGLQQQSPQRLVNRNEHMNRRRNHMIVIFNKLNNF